VISAPILLLDEASRVGGGVCIWDMSIFSPVEFGIDKGFRRMPARFPLTQDETGEEESLREGSTGGNGKWVCGEKWLT
jgi:hypothetical protein